MKERETSELETERRTDRIEGYETRETLRKDDKLLVRRYPVAEYHRKPSGSTEISCDFLATLNDVKRR